MARAPIELPGTEWACKIRTARANSLPRAQISVARVPMLELIGGFAYARTACRPTRTCVPNPGNDPIRWRQHLGLTGILDSGGRVSEETNTRDPLWMCPLRRWHFRPSGIARRRRTSLQRAYPRDG